MNILDLSRRNDFDRFQKEYMCIPPPHDEDACKAYKEWQEAADKWDEFHFIQLKGKHGMMNGRQITKIDHQKYPQPRMSEIARKYNITISDMKRHCKCHEEQR